MTSKDFKQLRKLFAKRRALDVESYEVDQQIDRLLRCVALEKQAMRSPNKTMTQRRAHARAIARKKL